MQLVIMQLTITILVILYNILSIDFNLYSLAGKKTFFLMQEIPGEKSFFEVGKRSYVVLYPGEYIMGNGVTDTIKIAGKTRIKLLIKVMEEGEIDCYVIRGKIRYNNYIYSDNDHLTLCGNDRMITGDGVMLGIVGQRRE